MGEGLGCTSELVLTTAAAMVSEAAMHSVSMGMKYW